VQRHLLDSSAAAVAGGQWMCCHFIALSLSLALTSQNGPNLLKGRTAFLAQQSVEKRKMRRRTSTPVKVVVHPLTIETPMPLHSVVMWLLLQKLGLGIEELALLCGFLCGLSRRSSCTAVGTLSSAGCSVQPVSLLRCELHQLKITFFLSSAINLTTV
jgi:hypothetical protein